MNQPLRHPVTRALAAVAVTLAGLQFAAASTGTDVRTPAAPGAPPTCVRVWAEARYGAIGYNHIVHIANACERAVTCSVATDVNPTPVDVAIAPKSEREVVTFLGSPASEFRPDVRCTFDGKS